MEVKVVTNPANTNFDIGKADCLNSAFNDPLQNYPIDNTGISPLPPLVIPNTGNHPFCMMTEMMGFIYKFFRDCPVIPEIKEAMAAGRNLIYLCSFQDTLPEHLRTLFDRTMIRSESWCLRFCGNDKLIDETKYFKFLGDLIRQQPEKIVYRLLDYCEEFDFLDSTLRDRSIRGSERLLKDKEPGKDNEGYLLQREINVLRSLLDNNKEVTVLIPYCVDIEDYKKIKKEIENSLSEHANFKLLKIGLSVENTYSAEHLNDFTDAAAFFFAPSDIRVSLQQSKGANETRANVDVTKGQDEVVAFVNDSLRKAVANGLKNVELLTCKILVGEINEFILPEKGIVVTDEYTPDQVVIPKRIRSIIEFLCRKGVTISETIRQALMNTAEELKLSGNE